MQDEVREKSVALTIKVDKAGGRLTAGLLKWAIRKYLAQAQNPKIHHGKQTVKQLVSQGAGVQNIVYFIFSQWNVAICRKIKLYNSYLDMRKRRTQGQQATASGAFLWAFLRI